MPFLHDRVYDFGLFVLVKETTLLTLTPTPAVDFTGARDDALVVGTREGPIVAGPSAAPDGGRRVTVSAFDDGTVVLNGTAAYWNLLDDNIKRLLASGALLEPKTVAVGNRFALPDFDVVMPPLAAPLP
jgi:hypothetical protein